MCSRPIQRISRKFSGHEPGVRLRKDAIVRRPGYLIAVVVLAVIVVAFWYLVFSPGWVERTGWESGDEAGALD